MLPYESLSHEDLTLPNHCPLKNDVSCEDVHEIIDVCLNSTIIGTRYQS